MKAKRRLDRLTNSVGPDDLCLVTVIGHRLTTRSNWSFENPGCPTVIVHAIGIGYAEPTDEQKETCRSLWLSSNTAPAAYQFPSTRLPTIEDGCGYNATTSPVPEAGASEETEA